MSAENAFALASDTLECRPGTLVARVGVETDAQHLPNLERMLEHQQLGLGIGTGANR